MKMGDIMTTTNKGTICGLVLGMLLLGWMSPVLAQQKTKQEEQQLQLDEPLFKPFIERYILDELKQLRTDQQILRTEMAEKVAEAKLTSSDRAMRYTADTTNNIFYIITAAASILVLVGWRSFREIRESVESITSQSSLT